MSTLSELITKMRASIYTNYSNEIDAQKHQALEIEIVTRLLQEIGAASGGYMGSLCHSDEAPLPGKNGFYVLKDAGKIAYITDQPSCNIGDYLSVIYSNGNYDYTLIPISQFLREISAEQYPFIEVAADSNNVFTIDYAATPKVHLVLGSNLIYTLDITNASTTAFGYIIVEQPGHKKLVRKSDSIIGDIVLPEGAGSKVLITYIKIDNEVYLQSQLIEDTTTAIIPSAISDFQSLFYNNQVVQFKWTAPHTVNTYTPVDYYEIRYSATASNADDTSVWGSMEKVVQTLIPNSPGSAESFTFTSLKGGREYYFYIKGVKIINGALYYSLGSPPVYCKTSGTSIPIGEDKYTVYKIPLESRNLVSRLKSTIINEYDNKLCEIDKTVDESEVDAYLPSGYIDTSNKDYSTYWSIYKYGRDGLYYANVIDLFSSFTLDKMFFLPVNKGLVSIYISEGFGHEWTLIAEYTDIYFKTWKTVDFSGKSGRFIKFQFDQQTYSAPGLSAPTYNPCLFDIYSIAIYGRNVDTSKINILPARYRNLTAKTVDQFFCTNGHFYQPGRIHSMCSGSRVRLFGAGGHFMNPAKKSSYTRITDLRFRLDNIPWVVNNGNGQTFQNMLKDTYKRYGLKPFIAFSSSLDICRYESTNRYNRPVDDYWYPGAWRPIVNAGYKGDAEYVAVTTDPDHYKTYAKMAAALAAKYGSVEISNPQYHIDQTADSNLDVGLDLLSGIEPENEPDQNWSGFRGYFMPEDIAAMMSAWYDGNSSKSVDEIGHLLGSANIDPLFLSVFPGTAGAALGYFYYSLLHWRLKRGDAVTPVACFNFHNYMSNIGEQGSSALAIQYAITYEKMLENTSGLQISKIVEFRDRFARDKEIWITEFGYGESGGRDTSSKYQCYSQEGRLLNGWLIPDRHRSDVKGAWTVRAALTMMRIGINQCNYYSTECEDSWFATGQYGGGAGTEMFRWQELTDTTPGAKVAAIRQYELQYNRGGFASFGLFGTLLTNGGYPISRAYWYIATFRNRLKDYVFIGTLKNPLSDKIIICCFKKKGEDKGAYAIYYNDSINTGIRNVNVPVPAGLNIVEAVNVYIPNLTDPTTISADLGTDIDRTGLPTSRREVYKNGAWVIENQVTHGISSMGSITTQPSVYPPNPQEGDVVVTIPSIEENPYYPVVGPVCAVTSKKVPTAPPGANGYIAKTGTTSDGTEIYGYAYALKNSWRQVDAVCDYIEFHPEGIKGSKGLETQIVVNSNTITIDVSEFPVYYFFDGVPDTDYSSSVTDLTGKALSSSSVQLAWTNNNVEDTKFIIYISESENAGFTIKDEVLISDENTAVISGLSPSTTYYFKVMPCKGSTEGRLSDTAAVKTQDKIEAVTGFTIDHSKTTSSVINLLWSFTLGDEGQFSAYQIYRSTDSVAWSNIVNITDINTHTYTDTGRTMSTTYYYKIRVVGVNGMGVFSDIISEATLSPEQARPIVLSAVTNKIGTQVVVTFDMNLSTSIVFNHSIFTLKEAGVPIIINSAYVNTDQPKQLILTLSAGVLSNYDSGKAVKLNYDPTSSNYIASSYGVAVQTFSDYVVINYNGNYSNLANTFKFSCQYAAGDNTDASWNYLVGDPSNNKVLTFTNLHNSSGINKFLGLVVSGGWASSTTEGLAPTFMTVPSYVYKKNWMVAYANTSTEASTGIFTFSGLNPNSKYTVRGYASRQYGSSAAASTERLKSGSKYSNSVFPYQNSAALSIKIGRLLSLL